MKNYALFILLLMLNSNLLASDTENVNVILRDNNQVEKATSSNPLRTDPTGTTTQPISGTVAISQITTNNDVDSNITNTSIAVDTLSTNDSIDAVPNRYSAKSGRVSKTSNISNATTDQIVYTVTVGKTFYLTTLLLSMYNTSAVNALHIEIEDNGTTKIPVSGPTAGLGAVSSIIPATISTVTFPEPIAFTNNVQFDIVTGTVTYSISVVGYEE